MTNYYIVENGYYKITRNIEAENKEKAIKEYEKWLDYACYSGDINLESSDREVFESDD